MAAAVHDAPAPLNVFDKFRKPRSRAESLASGNACTLIVCMNDAFAPTATPDKAENTTNPVAFGLPVAVLLARVGLARSTYFHQLRAMARPDRDAGLLALVREAFENSGRRYGYRRVWLELRGDGVVVSARRVMRLMTRHGLVPPAQAGAPVQLVQGRDRRRGAREPGGAGLPRRGAEPPVGHGHHRVPHPGGQGVPVAGDRLP